MEIAVGRFYRFKHRGKWPPSLQKSIPDDKLYFIHPVIVIAIQGMDLVDVVTTTSSPAFSTNAANYIRISQTVSKRLTDLTDPLIVNNKLPRDSCVVLDSKRRVNSAILELWIEEGVQFQLGKNSKKRLVQKVDERMRVVTQQSSDTLQVAPQQALAGLQVPPAASVPQPQPPPKPPATVPTNPWARAMAPSGPPPSVPLPPLPAPAQPQQPSLAAVLNPPPRTTSLPLPTSPKSDKSIDIADIKKSLTGLKVAVAALEGLCEKLEARTESPSTMAASSPIDETPDAPPRLIAHKASRMLGVPSESQEIAGHGDDSAKGESKRLRLKRWGSRLFMTREG